MSETIKKEIFPIAIFLDTNILDSLPEDILKSGELSGLIADANNIGSQVYIPDVVAREWFNHRYKKIIDSIESYAKQMDYLKKYFSTVPDFNIPAFDSYASFVKCVYKPFITSLRKSGCRLLGPPKVSIRTLTERAVWSIPPFKYSNKGLKDELVISSMLKLRARGWNYKTYVLITKDNDFVSDGLNKRFADLNINFERVNNIQEARKLLEIKLTEAWKKRKSALENEVMTFLKNNWETISHSVINQVKEKGVDRWTIFGYGQKDIPEFSQIKRIVDTAPIEIEHVDVGIEDGNTHEIPITIGVKTKLSIELEENPFLEKAFTEKLGLTGWTSLLKDSPGIRLRTHDIERQISLYSVVKRDNIGSLSQLNLVDIRPDYFKSLKELDEK